MCQLREDVSLFAQALFQLGFFLLDQLQLQRAVSGLLYLPLQCAQPNALALQLITAYRQGNQQCAAHRAEQTGRTRYCWNCGAWR